MKTFLLCLTTSFICLQSFAQTISTGPITGSPYTACGPLGVNVPFTITGIFNAGNIFTAEISDETGDFTIPESIGTLSATVSGSISTSIPPSVINGSGYRIRVISSNPAVIGSDNGVDIVLNRPVEICDGIDNNCDGVIDEGLAGCPNFWKGVNITWENNSNWSKGAPPAGCSENVQISATSNDPVLSTSVNVGNLTIESGAKITLNNTLNVCGDITVYDASLFGSGQLNLNGTGNQILTGTLRVYGILNVSSGSNLITNGGLILESSASLLHGAGLPGAGGTVTGSVTIKRSGSTHNSYNYWSTPVNNGTLPGSNGYYYNAANGTHGTSDDNNPSPDPGWTPASGPMITARGYASTASGLASFTGLPNEGAILYPVTTSGETLVSANPPSKFNLIGNPYPSSLSADLLYAGNTGTIAFAYYFWSDDNSSGSGYSSSDYAKYTDLGGTAASNGGQEPDGNIASCQGFIVEAIANDDLQFENSMRGSSNDKFYDEDEQLRKIWLNLSNEKSYAEILVGFASDATNQRDLRYDAYNLRVNKKCIFSALQQGEEFGIVAFPPLENEYVIPLVSLVSESGNYTIGMKKGENLTHVKVLLEDRRTGIFTDFQNAGSQYSVYLASDGKASRFYLHFTLDPSGTESIKSSNDITAYTNEQEIVISFNNLKDPKGTIQLYDITGRLLQQISEINPGNAAYRLNGVGLSPGIYIINFIGGDKRYSSKVVIK